MKSDAIVNAGEYAFSERKSGIRIPSSNKGFYYRKGTDLNDTDNYALSDTIARVERIGKKWAMLHPDHTPMNEKTFSTNGGDDALKPQASGAECNDDSYVTTGAYPPDDAVVYNDPLAGGIRFGIGDFSRAGGGFFYKINWNTNKLYFEDGKISADHASHESGTDVDVRYVRRKACGEGPVSFADSTRIAYDRALTRELMTLFAEEGAEIFFVDQFGRDKIFDVPDSTDPLKQQKDVDSSVSFGGKTVLVNRFAGHQDHFHVKFPDPYEPRREVTVLTAYDYTQTPSIVYGNAPELKRSETVTIETGILRDADHNWILIKETELLVSAKSAVNGTPAGNLYGPLCSGNAGYAICKVNADGKLKFNYTTSSSIVDNIVIQVKTRDGSFVLGTMQITILH